ncbi:nuclear transport factor 2 family protein [Phenylobacterium immobile]|uniref:nuclear transport factor 2 family protein n=1 Tax=Phenylobacterium immobile TaxID=21 RepID=UPI000AA3AAAB|nr:nuclear transport factor 2 family protein [Phenylobacterium immobile]
MKLSAIAAAGALLFAGAADAQALDGAAASQVLDSFHAAAARADTAYFDLFAPEGVFIGTDVSERWSVAQFRAYAEPAFKAGKGWIYRARDRHVAVAPCACVAWFDEVLDSRSYGTARGTGVLVAQDGVWKVSQYALTFPIPNDLAHEFTDRIKAYEAAHPTPAGPPTSR